MADDSIQKAWTGSTGTDLLETSIAFVQQVLMFSSHHLGGIRPDMRILDFGIGWGRIARLWLKYLPPHSLMWLRCLGTVYRSRKKLWVKKHHCSF